MKYNSLKFIFLSAFVLFFNGAAYSIEQGNSAWLYGKNESWVRQIQNYNTHAPTAHRLNYLFPETGIIHVDSEHNKLLITYDQSVTAFYKKRLKDTKILADLSFWVANTHFKDWSEKQYRQAADQIAMYINKDANTDGVFLDLEFYKPSLLPFYREMVKNFKEQHKILSVIVRPQQENTEWFKALGNNAFIVLYGYDLHEPHDSALPISPEKYQQRLKIAVLNIMKIAEQTHTAIMMGAPLIATTYEWEQKKINIKGNTKYLNNTYRQIDYFKSALAVYKEIQSPLYLGFSIWAFVDPAKKDIYSPLKISSAEWKLLNNYIA